MSPIEKIANVVVSPEISLLEALKKMDSERTKLLFVFDKNSFISLLTIGDIQRSIIKNISLDEKISKVIDTDKVYASSQDSLEDIKNLMIRERTQYMPVLDTNHSLKDVILWDELFMNTKPEKQEKIDIPVVIMAGGKGDRLKPLTNIIPKPLIPIGEKAIIEVILEQFESAGCHDFFISVNFKGELIKQFLSKLENKYNIVYFQENQPLGTIGSVALLKGQINTPFIVSNCDIIIDQDYQDVYNYHIENNNDITLVTAVESTRIPYGVVETGDDGLMIKLKEKPEYTFMVNTGVYILNPKMIDEIPAGHIFHITDLIDKVKSQGGRIGCFPIPKSSWKDMGEWPEYLKMIDVL